MNASRTTLRLIAWAALSLMVGLGAACGDTESHGVTEIVVPAGTSARLARGETVAVMPARLEFSVGDTLVIRNDDREATSVGPYWVEAGERFEVRFGEPGRFEGVCPLAESEHYEIVITG